LFDSQAKCQKELNDYIINELSEALDGQDEGFVEGHREGNKELHDALLKFCEYDEEKEYWTVKENPPMDDAKSLEVIREWVMEGEYIPEKWTYEIQEMTID
jgi:hypothetical protein